jgi:hypothetical protein
MVTPASEPKPHIERELEEHARHHRSTSDKKVFAEMATICAILIMLPLLGLTGAWRLLFLIPFIVAFFGAIQWRRLKVRLDELERRGAALTQAKGA